MIVLDSTVPMREFSKRYRSQSDVDRSVTMHQLSLDPHQPPISGGELRTVRRDVFAGCQRPFSCRFMDIATPNASPLREFKNITHYILFKPTRRTAKFGTTFDLKSFFISMWREDVVSFIEVAWEEKYSHRLFLVRLQVVKINLAARIEIYIHNR